VDSEGKGTAGSRINQNWPIEPVSLDDEEKAKQIIRRYNYKTFSYTDAASFAVMEGSA
jgi:predicted nucleic acid-binding protein